MKYAQLIIGLLAGTAIGGSVIASTGSPVAVGKGSEEQIKKVVRQVIMEEPKLILQSVQKFQMDQQKIQTSANSDVLKDPAISGFIFNNKETASHGPKDSKRVVAEFFDYNCGACKTMFKNLEALMKKDKTVRIVFHEYPIFGPVSDMNAKLGIAINRLYPDKYFSFHEKVMTHEGRVDDKVVLDYAKELGMDPEKIKAESGKKEVEDLLLATREIGIKINIQGTPTFAIGQEIVPHGMSLEDLEAKVKAADAANK